MMRPASLGSRAHIFRIYRDIDVRFILEDMYAKLELFDANKVGEGTNEICMQSYKYGI